MNEETIIPDWLTNIFLGYGDPAGAQYTSIIEEQPEVFIPKVDFKDTFLDSQHLIESFPGQPSLLLSSLNATVLHSAFTPSHLAFLSYILHPAQDEQILGELQHPKFARKSVPASGYSDFLIEINQ